MVTHESEDSFLLAIITKKKEKKQRGESTIDDIYIYMCFFIGLGGIGEL